MKRPYRASGVALIEALVAMAVMAFGMLALLGLQGTLRGNSDISKQRSEAVRYAQEKVETLRAFSLIGSLSGFSAYDDIIDDPLPQPVILPVGFSTNAAFQLQETVQSFPPLPPAVPTTFDLYYVSPHKNVLSTVSWKDRNNDLQLVQFPTVISRSAPEIAASLATPTTGSAAQQANARNVRIPVSAQDLGNGTSQFSPPGASPGVTWIFNNNTAYIEKTCTGATCTAANLRLLSGYVRFALGATPAPTSADAENPPPTGLPFPLAVNVMVFVYEPTAPTTVNCFSDGSDITAIAYYCAVPVKTAAGLKWTQWSLVQLNGLVSSGGVFAYNIADPTPSLYRVCRYTTALSNATSPPPVTNPNHPYQYDDLQESLSNQNFLIIRAGDGVSPFPCPDDNPATPIYGRTWHHQPAV